MDIRLAERVESLPVYIFSEINSIKKKVQDRGVELLSLAIGDPDQPTPKEIVERMKVAVAKSANHQYSPYEGTQALRNAFSNWMRKRFNVQVDAEREVIALIGSKEGLAHFPLAFCNPGDLCLYPSPGFPMYATAITLAGGVPKVLPLRYENQFLPDLNVLENMFRQDKVRFLFLNYPHNPTSVVCPRNTLEGVVAIAKKYGVVIAYDNAYSEIYYDENNKPMSILEIPGAKEVCIEFHSMSKTFNMTGWRLAFAVGNERLVQGLLKVKTNIDSGPLPAVQEASVYALENYESLTESIRKLYAERRNVLMKGLDALKIEYLPPPATFFLWAKVPNQRPSMDFVKSLIEQKGLVLTPGIGFGKEADCFFRMAMTVDIPQMERALDRLGEFLKQ